jgi:two-component system phosphate regulon sensor histidine kinase PhoR
MRIRWRLPLAFALGSLVFAGVVALVAALALRGVFLDRLEDEMVRQARQYAATLEADPAALGTGGALQSFTQQVGAAADARFTVIDHEGWVLADSQADPGGLENHSDRPEVAQALAGNEGRERRYSTTLGHEEVYVAIPLPAGEATWSEGVVRVAQPAGRIDAMLAASWRIPLIVWAVLLLPTVAFGYFLTRAITRPLERLRHMTAKVAAGEFAHRTSVHRKDELGELADSLNAMASQLETRDAQLTAETERLSEVLTSMSDGVLLVEADGRLLRANPAAERILGTRLSGAEGTPLVVTARSFPSRELAEKAAKAGRPVTEVLELPGGRSLTVEVVPLGLGDTASSTEHPAQAPRGQTLFVIRDETARRATERMRRDFATNVSHELKTPLAGLSLLAQTLAKAMRDDPEHAEVFVGQLSAEIGRLNELTNDLLTLSRLEDPEAGAAMSATSLDLTALAAETAGELRPAAEAKGHTLTVETTGECVVTGDGVALRTLIRNLLENAIRYTEPGGHIVLRVRAEATGEQDGVALSVTDDGVGIPSADQERIFERFYRVDKARSRETGGTGLGLSIVRHVAERHGGRVAVESTVGVGSTFTVWLPVKGETRDRG